MPIDNPNLVTRSATVQDTPVKFALLRGLAEYEQLVSDFVVTESDLTQSLFGPDPIANVILAYDGDKAVGLAVFCQRYSTFLGRQYLYLEDIFVVPSHRGSGIGRKLMEQAALLAQTLGSTMIEWSVLNWNEPAIKFYEHLGAKPVDGWKTYRLSGQALNQLANPR